MDNFSPDEMAGFERAALQPYLKLTTFMQRESKSGADTRSYVRKAESPDKNWALGLMCLEFRNGVYAFISELWECYDGEGLLGLDERWDIGKCIIPSGFSEDVIGDLLEYVGTSERMLAAGVEFSTTIRELESLFNRLVKKHEKPFPEPQNESAKLAVQAIIDASISQ